MNKSIETSIYCKSIKSMNWDSNSTSKSQELNESCTKTTKIEVLTSSGQSQEVHEHQDVEA